MAGRANGKTFEQGAVGKSQDGWNGWARKKWRQGNSRIKLP
jgi:hypothetical protein